MPAGQGAELLRQAIALLNERRLTSAEIALGAAEAVQADGDECAGARWFLAMLRGDFESAWQASDTIRSGGGKDPHRLWNGEVIVGKRVMVRCLHGFGDAVQMLRLLPMLREQAGHVIVQVAPGLLPLAGCFAGADEAITWGDNVPEPAWDLQVEVMELPYLLRLGSAQLPFATEYLRLPLEACRRASKSLPDAETRRLRVGLVWGAGDWNPSRSISVTHLEELLCFGRDAGVEFWSLQGSGATPQAVSLFQQGLLQDGSALTQGVVALGAVVAQMDLVITVDTLAAHLAGALGVRVWVLLQEYADWRWMVDRDSSPWYPSMRLFRRGTGEGWADLLARVQSTLAEELASLRGSEHG